MATGTRYWQNTTGGHNKDYRLDWDTEHLTITKTWGIIGGRHSVNTATYSSLHDVWKAITDITVRREDHGYTQMAMENTEVFAGVPRGIAFGQNFSNDIWDLKSYE